MEVVLLALVVICLAVIAGSLCGFSNSRCYSELSEQNQGRLRLDDCESTECQAAGRCKFAPKKKG